MVAHTLARELGDERAFVDTIARGDTPYLIIDFKLINADFEAIIKERFTMGKEELAILKLGNSELRIYLSSDFTHKPGEKVGFKLKNKGVFLFDKKSGERK